MKEDINFNVWVMFSAILQVVASSLLMCGGLVLAVMSYFDKTKLLEVEELNFFINQQGIVNLQQHIFGGMLQKEYLCFLLGLVIAIVGLTALIFAIVEILFVKNRTINNHRFAIVLFAMIPLLIAGCVEMYLLLGYNSLKANLDYMINIKTVCLNVCGAFSMCAIFKLVGVTLCHIPKDSKNVVEVVEAIQVLHNQRDEGKVKSINKSADHLVQSNESNAVNVKKSSAKAMATQDSAPKAKLEQDQALKAKPIMQSPRSKAQHLQSSRSGNILAGGEVRKSSKMEGQNAGLKSSVKPQKTTSMTGESVMRQRVRANRPLSQSNTTRQLIRNESISSRLANSKKSIKSCPKCGKILLVREKKCPDCGYAEGKNK